MVAVAGTGAVAVADAVAAAGAVFRCSSRQTVAVAVGEAVTVAVSNRSLRGFDVTPRAIYRSIGEFVRNSTATDSIVEHMRTATAAATATTTASATATTTQTADTQ